MRNLKMFTKLFLSHITVGLVAIISLAAILYAVFSDNLIQRTLNQLSSVNILKKELVANYFLRSQQNLEALQLEKKFLKIFTAVSGAVTNGISVHTSDMQDVENICRLYNFQNIHLYDLDHHELFSTDTTRYNENVLQRIDSAIKAEPNRLRLIDASHTSNKKQTLLFYYVPVMQDSQRVGVVLVEENFENVQSIVSEITGMGTTGESYIVGPGYTLRSASRFFDKPPGEITVRTQAVMNSFAGVAGSGIITDYRGEKVLSVYRPIGDFDLNWVIVSEIDWDEAMQPVVQFRYYLLGITFFIFFLTTIITFFISNAIAQPIQKLRVIINQLSRGVIPKRRIALNSKDEVGQMADAIYQLTEGMERTSKFAREIGSGNFNSSFETLSDQDALGHSLLHMRDELKSLNEREMKMARARASALLEGQERERRRIIQELHDGVGQLLTAIRMRLESLEGDSNMKEEIKKQINDTISEVRRISYNVMPQALVDFGLEAALAGLCDSVKRYSNLEIDFTYVKESDNTLNFEISTALFRIAQEGLNNIVKYAEASAVNLHIIDKEDEVYLVLEDNGKGFEESKLKVNGGMGLQNIRERAKLLNGSADIHSTPGEGTVIEIHIPIYPE
ncbi:MAG TPA: ATP-binding protein [Chryseolinea sp.]|nr:ATP-binding protein [Chryseolinea sp.]